MYSRHLHFCCFFVSFPMSSELPPPLTYAATTFADLARTFEESSLSPNNFFRSWLLEQHDLLDLRYDICIQKLKELLTKFEGADEQWLASVQLTNKLAEEYQVVDAAAHCRLKTQLCALREDELKKLGPEPQAPPVLSTEHSPHVMTQELHQLLPPSLVEVDDATLFAYNLCNKLLPGSLKRLYTRALTLAHVEAVAKYQDFRYRRLLIDIKYSEQFARSMEDGIKKHHKS